MLGFGKKKPSPEMELARKEQELTGNEMILRNPAEAEQDAMFHEQKEKMVMYRMWQQDWQPQQIMNFEYLSGFTMQKDGNYKKDEYRRKLCNIQGAYHINQFMAHQNRNLMNCTFLDVNDRNRYIKYNIIMPLTNDIFEHSDDWEINPIDFRQIITNTTNPVDNGTRRALNNGERRTDQQIIKTHELSNPRGDEKKQSFMGNPFK